jgi:pimeloyl-ACP methyl ester carboxylesterase
VRNAAGYVAACVARNHRVLPYLSTANVARDLDLLRQAVGDARLTFAGVSYGTVIGATYASLFPATTGRMVLDGAFDARQRAVDPMATWLEQAEGYEHALNRFLAACAADQAACSGFGGNDPDAALRGLVDRQPVPAPGADNPEPVDGDDARAAIARAMNAKFLWRPLAAGLAQAQAGDGSTLRALSDQWYELGPGGTRTPAYDQYVAIASVDSRYPRGVTPYLAAGRRPTRACRTSTG